MWDLFAKTVSTLLGKTNVCQAKATSAAHRVAKTLAHAHMGSLTSPTSPHYYGTPKQPTTQCEHARVSISGGSGE